MIKYIYNTQSNNLFLKYQGTISTFDIRENYERILNDKNLPETLLVIQDEKEARFIGTNDNIDSALQYAIKFSKRFKYIKIAIIQTNPISTAYSMLFKELNQVPNYFIEVFSTDQAAMKWVLSRNVR